MKTQVIIPAYNEGNRLGKLLDALPSHLVEPIISANGCTDDTVEVAQGYTDSIVVNEARDKLPGIQEVLKRLGERALEPIMLLDADTIPIWPDYWHDLSVGAMVERLDRPAVISAPVLYQQNRAGKFAPVVRSLFRYGQTVATHNTARHTGTGGGQYGPNMGMYLHSKHALEAVLNLPNIWPEEDVAYAQTVVESDPNAVFEQIIHPLATALTPEPAPMQPLLDWVKNPKQAMDETRRAYRDTGSPDAITYQEWIATRSTM